jgi:hypothetical protein
MVDLHASITTEPISARRISFASYNDDQTVRERNIRIFNSYEIHMDGNGVYQEVGLSKTETNIGERRAYAQFSSNVSCLCDKRLFQSSLGESPCQPRYRLARFEPYCRCSYC